MSSLVDEVIEAIQHVADRGVISNPDEREAPREYVDQTFLPLSADLFEALAEATELRTGNELTPPQRREGERPYARGLVMSATWFNEPRGSGRTRGVDPIGLALVTNVQ